MEIYERICKYDSDAKSDEYLRMRINPLRIQLGMEPLKTRAEKIAEQEKKSLELLKNDKEYEKLSHQLDFDIHLEYSHSTFLGNCESFKKSKYYSDILERINLIRKKYKLEPLVIYI